MNTLVIVLIAAVVLFGAYVFYGRWLANKWGIEMCIRDSLRSADVSQRAQNITLLHGVACCGIHCTYYTIFRRTNCCALCGLDRTENRHTIVDLSLIHI